MLKRLLGLVLFALIACAGVAQAQTTTVAPNGTVTTKPPVPMSSMMPSMAPAPSETVTMTAGQIAAIGVGAVAGVVLFQGAMWHGMVIVGAVVGGYVGDYLYGMHASGKSAS
jgi:hypothetical protein